MAIKKIINETVYLYGMILRVEYAKTRCPRIDFSIQKRAVGTEEILDIETHTYTLPDLGEDFFSISLLSEEGNNPYRAGYLWLKQNKLLFADWEDC